MEMLSNEEFILPEKWVVKALTDEEDEVIVNYINNTFGTRTSLGLGGNPYWCYSNTKMTHDNSNKHDGSELRSFPTATEISYQQFVKYVLENHVDEEVVEYNPNDPELEVILKRLLNIC